MRGHQVLQAYRKDTGEEEAIACFRKAIALARKVDEPHYDLGVLLGMKGELDEAIACYR
jgi:hypothetical protein